MGLGIDGGRCRAATVRIGGAWLIVAGVAGCDGGGEPSSVTADAPRVVCVGAAGEVVAIGTGPLSAIVVTIDGVDSTHPAIDGGSTEEHRVGFTCTSPGSIVWSVTARDGRGELAGSAGGTIECAPCSDAGTPPATDAGTPPATEYRYVCVEDQSSEADAPSGVELDAIQDYTGDDDAYASATTCNLGPRADATRSVCADAAGTKPFCAGDTGYLTLGGAGGWVCGRFDVPIANDHIITPAGCSASEALPVRVTICTEPDPTSSSCRPCPLELSSNRSCRVAGL